MSNVDLNWFQKLIRFIKRNVFYIVPKDEKYYVRDKVMESDHKTFLKLLIAIFIFQFAMITYTLVSCGFKPGPTSIKYLICYSFLAFFMLISYLMIKHFYKKRSTTGYFGWIAFIMNVFFIWAAAITIIDSRYSIELTTFSYVALALTAFVILEPWVFIVDVTAYIAIILVVLSYGTAPFRVGVVISSASIGVLSSIVGTINFIRRIRYINLQREITEINEGLRTNVYFDDLTRIHNRRFLTEHINDPINIGAFPSGVLMFDIDDFKKINDVYGHQSGDLCLREIGLAILDSLKEIENAYAVRYGGEEFIVYFETTCRQDLIDFAEKFRLNIQNKEITLHQGTKVMLTVSVGLALGKSHLSYSGLINNADQKLLEAKASGKNKVLI